MMKIYVVLMNEDARPFMKAELSLPGRLGVGILRFTKDQ